MFCTQASGLCGHFFLFLFRISNILLPSDVARITLHRLPDDGLSLPKMSRRVLDLARLFQVV
jgi:hypothetical protein